MKGNNMKDEEKYWDGVSVPQKGQKCRDGRDPFIINYEDMPEPVKFESGMKVYWYWFDTFSKASIAAWVAYNNASIRGWEYYGRCIPGTIEADEGLFKVTFP